MELNEKTKNIIENLPKNMPKMEKGILPLVNALNELPGITTVESCEGHNNQYPYVLFGVDKSTETIESLCFIAHTLKSYKWKLIASPLGSSKKLSLRFIIVSAYGLKDAEPEYHSVATRAKDPKMVIEVKKSILDIVRTLTYIKKSSKFV
jgi:hypothetical protein